MSKRFPLAKWVLPTVIDPSGRKCIQIPVPDDPAHIAAFRGAMLALASAYNWADDPSHRAKEVAQVWREIVDNLTAWGCDTVSTKIRVDSICELQWSYDDWATFESYDPSGCILANIDSIVPGMVHDAIIDAVNDGTIAGPEQPGPEWPPSEGQCKSFSIDLSSQGSWLGPVNVSSGDTITVSDATGGWTDGSGIGELGPWFCPDGSSYSYGQCWGNSGTTVDTDPLPTAYHMQIIGRIGSAYFDPMHGSYTVPAGITGQPFELMCNDSVRADNSGGCHLTCEVCAQIQPGALIWAGELDCNGGTTVMPVTTAQNKQYRLHFEGFFYFWLWLHPDRMADTFWNDDGGTWINQIPVRIDGGVPDPIPDRNPIGVYDITRQGTGSGFSFQIIDPQYDNAPVPSNPLRVSVYEL